MNTFLLKMVELSSKLYLDIAKNSREIEGEMLRKYPWTNRIFRSDRFRRAHLEVLDVRDTKKIWIMHICIFPHLDDSSPIFGFDVTCEEDKITKVFLDFSCAEENHPMNVWFRTKTKNLTWKKDKEFPDWNDRIFSSNMVLAGNSNTQEELKELVDVSEECLIYYLSKVGNTVEHFNNAFAHNHYCINRKQNVHTKRFLINCGYNEKDVDIFIDNHLFPEIESTYP